MERGRQHLFFLLTKQPLIGSMLLGRRPVLPNVLIGVSIEDQASARHRLPALRGIAGMGWRTWVSYEPALGPVDWAPFDFLHWLASGPETGPGRRPSALDWHRAARDHCRAHAIPYFYKPAPDLDGEPCRALVPLPGDRG
ncbi:hypothetical protein CCP1ISM_5120002 [Azospirillaceae bacterium]